MRRFCPQGFDDEIHRVLVLQGHHRIRQNRPVQPRFAMHMLGRDQRAPQWPVAPGEHLYIRSPRQFADNPRIAFSQVQRHISSHGGDTQHLQLGTGQRQQDRHGVVLPGIGINDDLARFHTAPLIGRDSGL